jgi:hypothetical protein
VPKLLGQRLQVQGQQLLGLVQGGDLQLGVLLLWQGLQLGVGEGLQLWQGLLQ